MANKSILEQLKDTKVQLEKLEQEKQQLTHQAEKIMARDRQIEQKKRTRRLIEKGAILESIHPSILSLSNQQLQTYLQRVLQTEQALELLQEIAKAENTQ